jgi:hypothetical protein
MHNSTLSIGLVQYNGKDAWDMHKGLVIAAVTTMLTGFEWAGECSERKTDVEIENEA